MGVAVAAGVFHRAWLPISVAAGVPLGLVLGALGIAEVGEFAAGAALHLSQGAIAAALGLGWWRARDSRDDSRDGGRRGSPG